MQKDLIEINKKIESIFTRTGGLKVFDEEKLAKISLNMKEIDRATHTAGRSNTQFKSKNMTLFMLGRTPFSMVSQCLAQIEQKRMALKEAIFKLRQDQIKVKKYYKMLEKEQDDLTVEKINVTIEKTKCGINDSALYIEGALKDVAQFQEIYNQIVKHNNMENWDELDFEKAEAEHHIKQSFLQAFRDIIMTGRVNIGNLEYFENCGVHPLSGVLEAEKFLKEQTTSIQSTNNLPDLQEMEDWLDQMVVKYKDAANERLERIGINPIDEWFIYKQNSMPREN